MNETPNNDPIREATELMQEQANDYLHLESSCVKLCEELIQGEPASIENLTRTGEAALFRMRSRLLRIIRALTLFAEARANSPEKVSLSAEARAAFENASGSLMNAAQLFQKTRERAAALTTSGSTFATACIEVCGIHPSTYKAPYARNGEVRPWA